MVKSDTPDRSRVALASLPFGTLRKAQRELARASAMDASEEESESGDDEVEESPSRYDVKAKGREVEESHKPRKEIPKRPHKHAYVAIRSALPWLIRSQPNGSDFEEASGQKETRRRWRESGAFLVFSQNFRPSTIFSGS